MQRDRLWMVREKYGISIVKGTDRLGTCSEQGTYYSIELSGWGLSSLRGQTLLYFCMKKYSVFSMYRPNMTHFADPRGLSRQWGTVCACMCHGFTTLSLTSFYLLNTIFLPSEFRLPLVNGFYLSVGRKSLVSTQLEPHPSFDHHYLVGLGLLSDATVELGWAICHPSGRYVPINIKQLLN